MFSIEIPMCDLPLIYSGNQCYRWKKINKDKYVVIDGKNIVVINQIGNKKYFVCSEEDFFNKWYNYFDVGYDYMDSLLACKKFAKEINSKCFLYSFIVKENRKLRILKNDLFQTMVYCMLSGIKEEKKNKIEHICNKCGDPKKNTISGLSIKWFTFPEAEKIDVEYLTGLNKNEVIRIRSLANKVKKNPDILEQIKQEKDYNKCYSMLESICDKPAWIKNVMFYALGVKEVFVLPKTIKQHLAIWNVTPEDFEPFKKYRGLLIEYLKIEKDKK